MIRTWTLTDGGQDKVAIARDVAEFLGEARESLDIALYDLRLGPDTENLVVGAINAAGARGVAVRLLYNVDHRGPIPVPPPAELRDEDIERLTVPSRSIPGIPDLMHHKFVVRDGQAVWTGSTNWTDDSWSREENVFLTVDAPALAKAYGLGFEQLWARRDVESSGKVEPRPVQVGHATVRPWFCPGYGEELSHRIAKALAKARRRIRICSPVLTSGPILGTLCQVVAEGRVDVRGCLDQTQTDQVFWQWHTNGVSGWKIPLLQTVIERSRLSGKASTQWTPGSVHDFMHAKVTVADDTVFVGSFNLSRSGERNAENVLEIADATVADTLSAFVESVQARYPSAVARVPATAPPQIDPPRIRTRL